LKEENEEERIKEKRRRKRASIEEYLKENNLVRE